MEIKGTNFLLRPWRIEDLESLVKHANNKKVSQYLRDRFPHPYTHKDGEYWINTGSKTQVNFAIQINNEAVGGVGLMLGADTARFTAEIGYWLGEPFWGKGICTETTTLLTQYGFDVLNLTRIWAGVFATNPASAKVLEKAHYTFESRQKNAVFKDNKVLDLLIYAQTQDQPRDPK